MYESTNTKSEHLYHKKIAADPRGRWYTPGLVNYEVEMDIQAVVFDADGVLLETAFFSDELERAYGLPKSATLPFFEGALEECILGRADLKQELEPFLATWQWPGSAQDFIDRWFAFADRVDPGLVETITRLRRRGLRCYLATNQEPYRIAYMRERMGFDEIFDEIFFAAALGCKKTDARFYQQVMQATHLAGEQIVFWDDSLDNIKVACEQGWHAEHYRSFAEFEQTFAGYLERG